MWVLPCSDVSSGVVVQRSQQWSFRQTGHCVPGLVYPATDCAGPCEDQRIGRCRHPLWRALFDGTPLRASVTLRAVLASLGARVIAGAVGRSASAIGRLASAAGRLASVVWCCVWSEVRNVVRAWRGSHRVVRWLRGSEATAKRRRPQRTAAALQERRPWRGLLDAAREERASVTPTAARDHHPKVEVSTGCGVVVRAQVRVARSRAAGRRPPPRVVWSGGLLRTPEQRPRRSGVDKTLQHGFVHARRDTVARVHG